MSVDFWPNLGSQNHRFLSISPCKWPKNPKNFPALRAGVLFFSKSYKCLAGGLIFFKSQTYFSPGGLSNGGGFKLYPWYWELRNSKHNPKRVTSILWVLAPSDHFGAIILAIISVFVFLAPGAIILGAIILAIILVFPFFFRALRARSF